MNKMKTKMKFLLQLIIILSLSNLSAQTIEHNKAVKLKVVVLGVKNDSLLVRGSDSIIKTISRTDYLNDYVRKTGSIAETITGEKTFTDNIKLSGDFTGGTPPGIIFYDSVEDLSSTLTYNAVDLLYRFPHAIFTDDYIKATDGIFSGKLNVNTAENVVAIFQSTDAVSQIQIQDIDTNFYLGVKSAQAYISPTGGSPNLGLAVNTDGSVEIASDVTATSGIFSGDVDITGDVMLGGIINSESGTITLDEEVAVNGSITILTDVKLNTNKKVIYDADGDGYAFTMSDLTDSLGFEEGAQIHSSYNQGVGHYFIDGEDLALTGINAASGIFSGNITASNGLFNGLTVYDDADINGAVTLGSSLDVNNSASVGGDLIVTGNIIASSGTGSFNDLSISGDIIANTGEISGRDLELAGWLGVTGAATFSSVVEFGGATEFIGPSQFNDSVEFVGDVDINEHLTVDGDFKAADGDFSGVLGVGTEYTDDAILTVSGGEVSNDIAVFRNINDITKAKISLDAVGSGELSLIDGSNNTNVFISSKSTTNSYFNAGNVGVGTSNPQSIFEVAQNVDNSSSTTLDANTQIIVKNDNANGSAVIKLMGTSSDSGVIAFGSGGGATTDKIHLTSRYNHTKILTAVADGNVEIPNGSLTVTGDVTTLTGSVTADEGNFSSFNLGTGNVSGDLAVTGDVTATSFSGDGSLLTGIVDGALSSNVALKDVENTFSQNQTISKNASAAQFNIRSSDTGTARVNLGDQSGAFQGGLQYDNTTETLGIYAGGLSNRLTLSSTDAIFTVDVDITGDLSAVNGDFSGVVTLDPSAAGSALQWYEYDSNTLAGALRSYSNRGEINLYNNGSTGTVLSTNVSYFSGNVGIGTTSPQGDLHVVGETGGQGRIYVSDKDAGEGYLNSLLITKSGTNTYIYNRDSGSLNLGTNDQSNNIVITNAGNLELSGNMDVTGDIKAVDSSNRSITLNVGGSNQIIETTGGLNIGAGTGAVRVTQYGVDSELTVDDAAQANKIVLKSNGASYLNGGDLSIGNGDLDVTGEVTATTTVSGANIRTSTSYTYATLPTATIGTIAHITDASTISYRADAVGGGSDFALVVYNGTKWIYH